MGDGAAATATFGDDAGNDAGDATSVAAMKGELWVTADIGECCCVPRAHSLDPVLPEPDSERGRESDPRSFVGGDPVVAVAGEATITLGLEVLLSVDDDDAAVLWGAV
jgi:hypothetical protein|mmetsp:Transcript_29842/g.88629  ORF Transcript_29842/g.88629 Transcript_29842/m.88629 type:complete len:108 (-) Transcript_29842:326-649(-)